jgi:chromosome segregation protein
MGEQSPLAIRGSSMQDVIFGGGRGAKARNSAEVEIVLDNSDCTVEVPLSEISILRRLDRSGEGEYRLNGARCRLTDVIEVLSDTGLGKETHSVISQGRVEAIVTSKPRDRRLLIEEAAGLGKHRKRRRRAQLKLERTQENLDRALDVEREARTRLRPLKRQAEAAELHERLERQMLEVRLELAVDEVRGKSEQLAAAESGVQQARERRQRVEAALQEVIDRRGATERELAERSAQREELTRRVFAARSSHERVQMRREQTLSTVTTVTQRIARAEIELHTLNELVARTSDASEQHGDGERISALEAELAQLELHREQELEREIAELLAEREQAQSEAELLAQRLADVEAQRREADERAELAREFLAQAELDVESARRHAASVGSELAAVNQFLRSHSQRVSTSHRSDAPSLLSEALAIQPGYELALAAALGSRLDGAIVADIQAAQELLDGAGADGAVALLSGPGDPERAGGTPVAKDPPAAGAQPLLELISGAPGVLELAGRLLGDTWVVERLQDLPPDFRGIAVTRGGRAWFARSGEVRQMAEGGSERVLAQRNERERLIAASEAAAQAEQQARELAERALAEVTAAALARTEADRALRDTERLATQAKEALRRSDWLIEQRRSMPQQGPVAVRRAELEGELQAERRQAERHAQEHQERLRRLARLRAQHTTDTELLPRAERLASVLEQAAAAVNESLHALERELSRDREDGEGVAAVLRAHAAQEAEIQGQLRAEGELVTQAEVSAQRLRDQAEEARLELEAVLERLQSSQPPQPPQALDEEQLQALQARLERLQRRREQLGPVNPLAQEEYAEALAHVEELEARRTDLESALRELRTVIRDTDRQIHETFEETFQAAARNFQELVGDVFPGGSGRLRLVSEGTAPRPVLGGQPLGGDPEEQADQEEEDLGELSGEELLGVEIEVTPAGKATKRLSLLSGGEKSMTALAFLFSVFLARPCPFYILDEVEAALDDLNLDRFLTLLRRYSDRAQFIVITHQKRTMEAADWLYGVSMGGDGVSKVISRRLPQEQTQGSEQDAEQPAAPQIAAL